MAEEKTGTTEIKDGTEAGTGSATSAPRELTRDELASQLVDRLSLWSGAAGGVLPPAIDMFGVGGVQLYMLRRLADIYGIPFSNDLGKSVLSSIVGALIPENASMAALSLLKGVPIAGHVISGVTMAGVSAAATWVMGRVFIKHFESGGTLLDFNPPDYREFIKVQKERYAARSASKVARAQSVNPSSQTDSSSSPSTAI